MDNIFRSRPRQNRLNVRFQLVRGLVAAFRFFLERAQHDFVEAHIDLHLARGGLEFSRRQFAGQHLVEDHSQRINVRAMVGLLRFGPLLRRHVMGCTGGAVIGRQRGGADHSSDAKIGDFDAAGLVQEQVLRLDVAVDDTAIVGELQRVANRRHDGQGLLGCEPASAQGLPQVDSIHELHQQIKNPA